MDRAAQRKYDPFEYIRNYYNVPAKKGGRVILDGKQRSGTITGVDGPHLMIRLDGNKYSRPYHPTDGIQYEESNS